MALAATAQCPPVGKRCRIRFSCGAVEGGGDVQVGGMASELNWTHAVAAAAGAATAAVLLKQTTTSEDTPQSKQKLHVIWPHPILVAHGNLIANDMGP